MDKQFINATNLADLECSSGSESQKYFEIGNKEIDELYASYNNMKHFSSQISQRIDFNPIQILQKYAERPMKVEIVAKNVMQILDKRIQRMLKNKRLKKNWSSQDAQILYWTFSHYCKAHDINTVEQADLSVWKNTSKLIPGSTPDSCMFKILSLKKTKLAIQKWSEQQSQLLSEIAMNYQGKKNWRSIAQELFKKYKNENKIFRNAKQCKQHWVCYLNPQLKKGSWSVNQDRKLMQFIYKGNGSRKWAQIARVFGGRTQNALKNRYTLIIERLRKQKNFQDSSNDLELVKNYLEKSDKSQPQAQQGRNLNRQITKINYSNNELVEQTSSKKNEEENQRGRDKQQIIENFGHNQIYPIFPLTTSLQLNSAFVQMDSRSLCSIQIPCIPNFNSGNPVYFIYSPFGNTSQN